MYNFCLFWLSCCWISQGPLEKWTEHSKKLQVVVFPLTLISLINEESHLYITAAGPPKYSTSWWSAPSISSKVLGFMVLIHENVGTTMLWNSCFVFAQDIRILDLTFCWKIKIHNSKKTNSRKTKVILYTTCVH